jgi:hypothetical protein
MSAQYPDRKKILIVSRSFYPMNSPRSFRTTELVKEFARQGHMITFCTLRHEKFHLSLEDDYSLTIKCMGLLTSEGRV